MRAFINYFPPKPSPHPACPSSLHLLKTPEVVLLVLDVLDEDEFGGVELLADLAEALEELVVFLLVLAMNQNIQLILQILRISLPTLTCLITFLAGTTTTPTFPIPSISPSISFIYHKNLPVLLARFRIPVSRRRPPFFGAGGTSVLFFLGVVVVGWGGGGVMVGRVRRNEVHHKILAIADTMLVAVKAHLLNVSAVRYLNYSREDLKLLCDADALDVEDAEFGAAERVVVEGPLFVPGF